MSLAALGLPDRRKLSSTRLIVAKLLKNATRLSDGFYVVLNSTYSKQPARGGLLPVFGLAEKLLFSTLSLAN
jgi:hypothetical protein